ncbi:MAG: hypothetical protein JWQ25_312, partial [Daejeonella sp.]|nr:hypothetical protein [Daejeonella sp.]
KNDELKTGSLIFTDVSVQAGLRTNWEKTFPTWFWDFDNDGWLDILVCSYSFDKTLPYYSAAEALNYPAGSTGKIILFKNKQDGTFEDVSAKTGINKVAFAMGSNFGDIDNDGYLDLYLGTGNPLLNSLVPNKMFHNIGGKHFLDVTNSSRTGNLQKGHGVSFADLDNDGDLDIYIEMGGAYLSDAYPNSLYINPGQNNNHWLNLSLTGTKSNRAAIGAKIKINFTDNGVQRSVYRDVNSGGSLGSNPLMQHIGIGLANSVDRIEIIWPGNKIPQVFTSVKTNTTYNIRENSNSLTVIKRNIIDFTKNSLRGTICGVQ